MVWEHQVKKNFLFPEEVGESKRHRQYFVCVLKELNRNLRES